MARSRHHHINRCGGRFIGTVKRELATSPIADATDLTTALQTIRVWYNHERPHDHLQGRTPAEVWAGIDV
ncbi:MAG: integrase core domain-containing protein, partial [Nitrospira sp.]|nr:integrase core domain-containing protein [Nitrospira sp.]